MELVRDGVARACGLTDVVAKRSLLLLGGFDLMLLHVPTMNDEVHQDADKGCNEKEDNPKGLLGAAEEVLAEEVDDDLDQKEDPKEEDEEEQNREEDVSATITVLS